MCFVSLDAVGIKSLKVKTELLPFFLWSFLDLSKPFDHLESSY